MELISSLIDDVERQAEAHQLSTFLMMKTPQIENIKILKALIYAKEDQLPLYDGFTKRRASIDVLRRKNVLLFISGLYTSIDDELYILELMYKEAKQNPSRTESMFNIVWQPVVELSIQWDKTMQKQFKTLQQKMPWYSVFHPSLLDPDVIRYIKNNWLFNFNQPLLVVIDSQGQFVNRNAIHMIYIWGTAAFPFTNQREEALWKEETWRIELIIGGIERLMFSWIAKNKYICLYGGEDIEWIRRFTSTARAVAHEAQIPLEMLYVGKRRPRENVQRINTIIEEEKLSHILQDLRLVWFFWIRIESMCYSKYKVQYVSSVENDPILQEIIKMLMLRFDDRDQGWAMISRGSEGVASSIGETIYQALTEYKVWKTFTEKGFVNALNDYLYRFDNAILIEKFNMYLCCTD